MSIIMIHLLTSTDTIVFSEMTADRMLFVFVFVGELYVSDKQGSDEDGDGSEQKPFKTPLKV